MAVIPLNERLHEDVCDVVDSMVSSFPEGLWKLLQRRNFRLTLIFEGVKDGKIKITTHFDHKHLKEVIRDV